MIEEQKSEFVSVRIHDLKKLIEYADTCAVILKNMGYPGKAEALEYRYMAIAEQIFYK